MTSRGAGLEQPRITGTRLPIISVATFEHFLALVAREHGVFRRFDRRHRDRVAIVNEKFDFLFERLVIDAIVQRRKASDRRR